jgi:hypothetical protein
MALGQLPVAPGQQRSFRRMRQVLSWALARSPGAEPGVRAVGALLRGGLVPSAIGRADEFLTEVALIAQHGQAAGCQGLR